MNTNIGSRLEIRNKKKKKISHDQFDRERKEMKKRRSQRENVHDSYPCKCIS